MNTRKPKQVLIYWKYLDKSGVYEDTQPFVSWDEEANNWSTFWWEEGNGGCDCNRSRSFGLGEFDCGETIEVTDIEITD